MLRSVIGAAMALAIFSGETVISTSANAGGGAASAVKRTNAAANASAWNRARIARNRQLRGNEITEFSSSSRGH
jgi:hypothetical protein